MRLLDLFCGAGGAAMGYHRAGFEVVGVDNRPQPRYPFEFHEADALTFPLDGFDVIHASPPCQWYSIALRSRPESRANHAPIIDVVRGLLQASGAVYVIENVEGARKWMVEPVLLCGSMFDRHIRRHRLFEANVPFLVPRCQHGVEPLRAERYITTTRPRTGHRAFSPFVNAHATGARWNTDALRDAIGVEWMHSTTEIRESIPPDYTELLGHQLATMFHLTRPPLSHKPKRNSLEAVAVDGQAALVAGDERPTAG